MFERFKSRSLELERLDTGDYTPEEYVRWQQEMKYIHRFFGEERALKRTLFKDLEADRIEMPAILDVGAGSGGLLRQLTTWIDDRRSMFVGCELNETAARSINTDGVFGVQCDAMKLPFGDDSFDYAYCSLFLHHLEDDDAKRLITEMGRVASRRIYIIDLDRSALAYYAYKLFGRFVLQKFSLEDGSLSILRSRTLDELKQLGEKGGLQNVKVERSFINRLILSGNIGKDGRD